MLGSTSLTLPLAGAGGFIAARAALHWALRRALRAPRLREDADLTRHGMNGLAVAIPTVRALNLFAWLLPAGTASAPAAAVVVLHGWGGNAEVMLPIAMPLHAAGYAVLVIDARNHGRSDDDDFSSLPRFAEDLDAALDWLRARPEIDATRIAVLGHSVGASATLLSASRRTDIAAVVSLAAFAHPAMVMRQWLAAKRVPYVPIGWYVLRYVQRVIGHRFDDIAPINTIARVRCPVLLMHGSDDRTVPSEQAHLIHARRASDAVQLRIQPGEHDAMDALLRHIDEILAFLHQALRANARRCDARVNAGS